MILDHSIMNQRAAACRCNNEAARQLVLTGDAQSAMPGFRMALQYLRSNIENNDDQHGITDALSSKPTSLFRISFPSKDHENVSPHNAFCFYHRVMMVLEHDDTDIDDNLLCMAVLFNLGVTRHHFGLTKNDDSTTASFQKALELYKMVLAVTQQRQETSPKKTDATVRLMLLAVFSNMGHIYSHFSRPCEENVCQQQLTAVMADSACLKLLESDEAQIFRINAYQRAAWAPAA